MNEKGNGPIHRAPALAGRGIIEQGLGKNVVLLRNLGRRQYHAALWPAPGVHIFQKEILFA
jgi:hypothetical protein